MVFIKIPSSSSQKRYIQTLPILNIPLILFIYGTCVNLPGAGRTVNLREGGHRDIYDCKFMTIPPRYLKLWELEFTQNCLQDFVVNLNLQTQHCSAKTRKCWEVPEGWWQKGGIGIQKKPWRPNKNYGTVFVIQQSATWSVQKRRRNGIKIMRECSLVRIGGIS